MLIILSGMPGTGKSAIADGVGRALRVPVLSVDPIESEMLEAGIARSFETGLAAYMVAHALADRSLAEGLDAVIDAVNSVELARDMWRGLAAKHGATLLVIECVLNDPEVQKSRLATRDRGLALPEPAWADVERRQSEWTAWPEPHLTLDALDPIEANLARALDFVGRG